MIKILILLLFLTLPFGQLTKIPLSLTGTSIYFYDLLIAVIFLLWLTTKPKKPKILIRPTLIFILTCLISLIFASTNFSFNQLVLSSLYLIRFTLYFTLLPVLSDKRLNLPLKNLLIYSSLGLAVLGLIQYSALPDTRFLTYLNFDDHYFRVIATLGDPSFVGIILILGLILVFFTKKPWYYYLVFLLPLLLTYSRSSYLSLILTAISIGIIKKQLKLIIVVSLFLLISLPFLPRPGGEGVKLERLFSIYQRQDNWQQSFKIFKTSPITGIGFNTLRFYQAKINPKSDWLNSHAASGLDSSLLFILATTGIIGFTAYLNLITKLFKISSILKVSLIALLTHSLFQNSLFYSLTMIWIWILAADQS